MRRLVPVSLGARRHDQSISSDDVVGFVNAEDRPTNEQILSVWCRGRDIANAIELAVDVEDSIRFEVLFLHFDSKWDYRDRSHVWEVLEFVPVDAAEYYRQ